MSIVFLILYRFTKNKPQNTNKNQQKPAKTSHSQNKTKISIRKKVVAAEELNIFELENNINHPTITYYVVVHGKCTFVNWKLVKKTILKEKITFR